jgi:hypothetical protein
VHINIGATAGAPGESVTVTVSLRVAGLSVAATTNDILFDPEKLTIDPASCRGNPNILKTLLATAVQPNRVRIFIQSSPTTDPIPDGVLYTCIVSIAPATLPGSYLLENSTTMAFDAAGTPIARVVGGDGVVTVSLLPLTATPTPSQTATQTTTPIPCVGDCSGRHTVTVNDVIMLVNIALGTAQPSACPDGVPSGTDVNVALIIQAVNNALNSCSG